MVRIGVAVGVQSRIGWKLDMWLRISIDVGQDRRVAAQNEIVRLARLLLVLRWLRTGDLEDVELFDQCRRVLGFGQEFARLSRKIWSVLKNSSHLRPSEIGASFA